MANALRYIVNVSIGLVASGLLLSGISLAEPLDPTELPTPEETLTQIQREWSRNQREYAKEQRRLHAEAEKLRKQLCEKGEEKHCPAPAVVKKSGDVDIRKLAYAVAMAETEDCTTGVGVSKNNCHGIIDCKNGPCGFRAFASKEESYKAFEEIWYRVYRGRFPTIKDAQIYTDNPNPTDWYATVTSVYNQVD